PLNQRPLRLILLGAPQFTSTHRTTTPRIPSPRNRDSMRRLLRSSLLLRHLAGACALMLASSALLGCGDTNPSTPSHSGEDSGGASGGAQSGSGGNASSAGG